MTLVLNETSSGLLPANSTSKTTRLPDELCPCSLCGKRLRESTTGRYPYGDGYICRTCRDETGEEFCQAMDAYSAQIDNDVDPVVSLLRLL